LAPMPSEPALEAAVLSVKGVGEEEAPRCDE
jgi:hypothetical protein